MRGSEDAACPSRRRTASRARSALAALMLLALVACGDVFGPATQYGSVTVLVEDTLGGPAAGVGLTLYTGERHMGYGATNAAGRHTFSFVPAGTYGVHATVPEGWTVPQGMTNFAIFDVDEGDAREVRIVLAGPAQATATARVEGR